MIRRSLCAAVSASSDAISYPLALGVNSGVGSTVLPLIVSCLFSAAPVAQNFRGNPLHVRLSHYGVVVSWDIAYRESASYDRRPYSHHPIAVSSSLLRAAQQGRHGHWTLRVSSNSRLKGPVGGSGRTHAPGCQSC